MSKSLPTVTSSIPRDLRTFIDRVRELVTGTGDTRLVSVKELSDAGIITTTNGGSVISTPETTVFGSPPAPTNVQASAAIDNVIVTWDSPTYSSHAYAEVWGASTDDIATAVLLGQAPGAIYSDPLGPGLSRYYWVRFVNTQFTVGSYNSISGTLATTSPDLTYTMSVLSAAYGDTSAAPFFTLASPQVIGGVTIPAGVYMKAAFIYDGVINNAKIADLAVDNAKISGLSATKINAGYISADRIQSGSIDAKIAAIDAAVIGSGFIDAARINTASIANANITAAQITSGTIENARVGNIQSTAYLSETTGWKLDKEGIAELNSATFRGTINIKSGTTGARVEMTNSVIKVYDSAGTLRVKIGDLSA